MSDSQFMKLRRRQLDRAFMARLAEAPAFKRGYIREIRDSLGVTTTQLAKKLGVSQPAISQLESSEREGSITLKTLARVADALDCKLVYALVPKTSLDDALHERAFGLAKQLITQVDHHMTLEGQKVSPEELETAIVELAEELIRNRDRRIWDERQ